MNEYRVTKYDANIPDAHANYLSADWCDISDVGKEFLGKKLTAVIYENIENAFLDTALLCLKDAGVSHMLVKYHPDEIFAPSKFRNGDTITIDELREVLRSILRTEYWCKLESSNGAFVHFGYDFHMYLGTPSHGSDWKAFAIQNGLFVDNCESPCKEEQGNEFDAEA
jgi:hypothetical protein